MFAESDNADSTVDEVFEDLSESLHEEIVIYNVKDGKYETCLGFEIQFIEKMPA